MELPDTSCDRNDCRFTFGPAATTLLYYTPIYDKHGNNTNPDGNTTTCDITCSTCKRVWRSTRRYGITKYAIVGL